MVPCLARPKCASFCFVFLSVRQDNSNNSTPQDSKRHENGKTKVDTSTPYGRKQAHLHIVIEHVFYRNLVRTAVIILIVSIAMTIIDHIYLVAVSRYQQQQIFSSASIGWPLKPNLKQLLGVLIIPYQVCIPTDQGEAVDI